MAIHYRGRAIPRAPHGRCDAEPGDLERIAESVADRQLAVLIAATYPIEQIREAVALQAGRHAHGWPS